MIKSNIKLILIALFVSTILYIAILPKTCVYPYIVDSQTLPRAIYNIRTDFTCGFPIRVMAWRDEGVDSIKHIPNVLIWTGAVYVLLYTIKRLKK